MTINSFAEANKYLARFYDNARTRYTLDNMRQLMIYLGSPQERYKTVHIAGTSGKTSTAYYVAALLRQAGYKTGLTVSPHVDEINERVQINGEPLPEVEFCQALSEFLDVIEHSPVEPSWFEFMVAFAYWYFALAEVEYAVIEVGLGGLKDGTNVIARPDKICVITDIGLDHTQILGNSLAEIAAQKAGIIHPDNYVFMYRQGPEVSAVVQSAVIAQGAKLKFVKPQVDQEADLPLFQQRNFYLAQRTANFALKRDGNPTLTDQQVRAASQAYIPGRMEIVHYHDKTVILDGAHNAQKLEALTDSLSDKYAGKRVAVLASFVEGDEQRLRGALGTISKLSNSLIVTSFVTAKDYLKHSANLDLIAEAARAEDIQVVVEPNAARAFDMLLDRPEEVLLVTGSFYLLNHIRPLMLKA